MVHVTIRNINYLEDVNLRNRGNKQKYYEILPVVEQ